MRTHTATPPRGATQSAWKLDEQDTIQKFSLPRINMSDHSAIEWTDATWNPVRGCTKVSPGCKHCYAEKFSERFRGVPGHPFENGFDLQLVPKAPELPLRWRTSRLIFANSMSDL